MNFEFSFETQLSLEIFLEALYQFLHAFATKKALK